MLSICKNAQARSKFHGMDFNMRTSTALVVKTISQIFSTMGAMLFLVIASLSFIACQSDDVATMTSDSSHETLGTSSRAQAAAIGDNEFVVVEADDNTIYAHYDNWINVVYAHRNASSFQFSTTFPSRLHIDSVTTDGTGTVTSSGNRITYSNWNSSERSSIIDVLVCDNIGECRTFNIFVTLNAPATYNPKVITKRVARGVTLNQPTGTPESEQDGNTLHHKNRYEFVSNSNAGGRCTLTGDSQAPGIQFTSQASDPLQTYSCTVRYCFKPNNICDTRTFQYQVTDSFEAWVDSTDQGAVWTGRQSQGSELVNQVWVPVGTQSVSIPILGEQPIESIQPGKGVGSVSITYGTNTIAYTPQASVRDVPNSKTIQDITAYGTQTKTSYPFNIEVIYNDPPTISEQAGTGFLEESDYDTGLKYPVNPDAGDFGSIAGVTTTRTSSKGTCQMTNNTLVITKGNATPGDLISCGVTVCEEKPKALCTTSAYQALVVSNPVLENGQAELSAGATTPTIVNVRDLLTHSSTNPALNTSSVQLSNIPPGVHVTATPQGIDTELEIMVDEDYQGASSTAFQFTIADSEGRRSDSVTIALTIHKAPQLEAFDTIWILSTQKNTVEGLFPTNTINTITGVPNDTLLSFEITEQNNLVVTPEPTFLGPVTIDIRSCDITHTQACRHYEVPLLVNDRPHISIPSMEVRVNSTVILDLFADAEILDPGEYGTLDKASIKFSGDNGLVDRIEDKNGTAFIEDGKIHFTASSNHGGGFQHLVRICEEEHPESCKGDSTFFIIVDYSHPSPDHLTLREGETILFTNLSTDYVSGILANDGYVDYDSFAWEVTPQQDDNDVEIYPTAQGGFIEATEEGDGFVNWRYTPPDNFTGDDEIDYKICYYDLNVLPHETDPHCESVQVRFTVIEGSAIIIDEVHTGGFAGEYPTLLGRATAHTAISIAQDGEDIDAFDADEHGDWRWTAATPIPPGEHTLTVTASNTSYDETTITVLAGEYPATDVFSTTMDTPYAFNQDLLLANDGDVDAASFGWTSPPVEDQEQVFSTSEQGTIAWVENDTSIRWQYTPPAGFIGEDSATYYICDKDILMPRCEEVRVIFSVLDDIVVRITDVQRTDDADMQPTVIGVAFPNTSIIVRIDDTDVDTVSSDADGHWSWTPETPFVAGTYIITVTASNGSVDSTMLTFNALVVAPPDTSNPDEQRPTIHGKGKPNSTITIIINGRETATVQVDADGNWSWTPNANIEPGDYTITIRAADGSSTEIQITIRNAFTGTGRDNIHISRPVADATTAQRTPIIAGTGTPDEPITLYIDYIQVGTTTANDEGEWIWQVSHALAIGTHRISAYGNNGRSANLELNIQNADGYQGDIQILSPDNHAEINSTSVTVNGRASANSTVLIVFDDRPTVTLRTNEQGEWLWTSDSQTSEGVHTIAAIADNGSVAEITVTLFTDIEASGCGTHSSTPSPTTWWIAMAGLIGLMRIRRRRVVESART